jgi:hypothetical protein
MPIVMETRNASEPVEDVAPAHQHGCRDTDTGDDGHDESDGGDGGYDPLVQKSYLVVPDILANAGGVTASYFEWAQSRQPYAWGEELASEQLRRRMEAGFTAVRAKANDLGVSLRRAAFALGVERIAEAIVARGLFP